MAEPPLLSGATQLVVHVPVPPDVVTERGAPGSVATACGVTEIRADSTPAVPLLFVATTETQYVVPFTNAGVEIVHNRVGALAVHDEICVPPVEAE
jgi:hypothetical protein